MNGYDKLAVAILQQSVKDYQTALKKRDSDRIAYFEKWFMDDWAQLLSGDMGEAIINRCKKRVLESARPNRLANKVDNPIQREVLDRG